MNVPAMPVMLGVLAVLAIAYRYYSAFLAAKVAVLDDSRHHARPHAQRRPELPPHEQVGAVRPSLRGHLRRGAADRAGAGDPVRLPAGPDLAGGRRLPGRRGAGHAGAGRVGPPRRPEPRRDRPRRDRAGRRACAAVGRHPVHRHHRPGRAGHRRRQGARRRGGADAGRHACSTCPPTRASRSARPSRRPDGLPGPARRRPISFGEGPTQAMDVPRAVPARRPARGRALASSRRRQAGYRPARRARRLVPGSSWGTFTIACTIPIALFVGLYMYRLRKGQGRRGVAHRRGRRAGGDRRRQLDPRLAAGAVLLAHARRRRSSPSAPTASSPRCCRSGCCSARATTCRAS